jgi:CheY-like chemotaxis protein
LRVRDSGPGIPAELVERIFEPFFTTKPRGIGLGLGLPQVRRVVEEHSGVLSIETAAGAGATFELSFAASAPPSAASSEIAPPPPPPVLLHGPRVLLVEDEEDIAQLIREALTTVRLEHCASVVAAVKAIGEATVPFDVMLLDMNLSGGSSRAVFRAARARWPRLPIIVTTGWAPEEELRALLAEPHTHYLRKPFGVSDLRGQVARACERSGPLAVATSSEPA